VVGRWRSPGGTGAARPAGCEGEAAADDGAGVIVEAPDAAEAGGTRDEPADPDADPDASDAGLF